MLNDREAEANSPQNLEEESPAGYIKVDSPFRAEEESPTMLTTTEAINFNHFKTDLYYLF